MKNIKIIVPGGLNTDIIGMGVKEIIGKGELSLGGELKVGPGGKSRNLAQMIAVLSGKNKVAMIGKTSKDPFGFWKFPFDALKKNEVNVDFVKVLDFKETNKFPGIALIPVDKNGNNQIYVLPGINEDFTIQDIDDAEILFQSAGKNKGILALTLEMPYKTLLYSIKKAHQFGMKIILDPGGIVKGNDYSELLEQELFLIKPNEFEAEILSGIKIKDFKTAKKAGDFFLNRKIENVLITHGKEGAYFFSKNIGKHFEIPKGIIGKTKDETGCGDQTMASLVYFISEGFELNEAIRLAIVSGTLQFYKSGINPIKLEDFKSFINLKK